jgi:hypothetical protein
MARTHSFTAEDVMPAKADVFAAMGIADAAAAGEKLLKLYREAAEFFLQTAKPAAITEEIPQDVFEHILEGEGGNEPKIPINDVYPNAVSLSLFALTLGAEVSARIEALFAANDFALGYVLDAVASEAAECAADRLEAIVAGEAPKPEGADIVSLRYSPGYCGWHISGQKRLFERLKPGEIGITLNSSCLMQPLKSVSGVIVSAELKHHLIKSDYPFCAACPHRSCRKRINLLLNRNNKH